MTYDTVSSEVCITGILPDRYPGDLTVDPTDEATVYVTLSGFGSSHAFRSTDYGTTWTDIDNGVLPDVPTSAVIVPTGSARSMPCSEARSDPAPGSE